MTASSQTQQPVDSTDAAAPPTGLVESLLGLRRPIIVGHVVPDADCLGSAFALAATLRDQGVDARVGLPGGSVSRRIRFMLDLVPACPHAATMPDECDGIIAVDTAVEKRINFEPRPAFPNALTTINIDHHITNSDYAAVNWVNPHASSTCEMIAGLFRAAGWTPAPAVASLLYAGIHGDTAGFSLPCTSAEALSAAADLVRAGADVTHIGEKLCRSHDSTDFELLRRVYDHTQVVADGRIAYSYLSHDDIVASRCTAADIDDQVSIPRALKDVRIAIFFSEGDPGVTRVNLRGEGNVSVIEVAERFGGGGHTQSAGIRVRTKPLEQVITEVVAAAEEHLDKNHNED